MKLLAASLLAVFGTVLHAAAPSDTPTTAPTPGIDSRFTLVWADEFDKPGAPDPKKWSYEEGFLRNKEQQYYTKDKRKNVRVEKGCLVIEAHKERVKNKRYKKGSDNWMEAEYGEYTSGDIVTLGKFSQKYGRFEMRAKLPKGQGIWPAFWMMGDDIRTVGYPKCGEIDVMEFIGKEPNTVYATLHIPPPKDSKAFKTSRGGSIKDNTLSTAFHIYAVEWTPEEISFFFDTKKFHTVKMADLGPEPPFHKPFYILLNLAIGGNWPGPVDPAVLPQKYLIDYVRVYKLNDGK